MRRCNIFFVKRGKQVQKGDINSRYQIVAFNAYEYRIIEYSTTERFIQLLSRVVANTKWSLFMISASTPSSKKYLAHMAVNVLASDCRLLVKIRYYLRLFFYLPRRTRSAFQNNWFTKWANRDASTCVHIFGMHNCISRKVNILFGKFM